MKVFILFFLVFFLNICKTNSLQLIRVGETAVSLGQNVEFIERVAELCDCEIHAGVAGEANR